MERSRLCDCTVTFIKTFFAVLATLGTVLAVAWWKFAREPGESPPGTWVVVILVIALLVALVKGFGREFEEWWHNVEHLRDNNEIQSVLTKMIEKAKAVAFLGRLDATIADSVLQRAKQSTPAFGRICIRNTDAEFYENNSALAKELVEFDSKHDNFESRFLFSKQFFDLLVVTDEKDRNDILLKWKESTGGWHGIRVNGLARPDEGCFNPAISWDDPDGKQAANLKATAQLFDDYCLAIRGEETDGEGWSWPVLPGQDSVADLMRRENLSWFDEVARHLISSGTEENCVQVTWRLHPNSARDAEQFKDWLGTLDKSKVQVDRYLLIDTASLTNSEYVNVVRGIVRDHFSGTPRRAPSQGYRLHYVPINQLSSLGVPTRDFALFEMARGTWAQGSLVSTDNHSRFLRAWFCRTSKEVKKYKGYFTTLQHKARKYETLVSTCVS